MLIGENVPLKPYRKPSAWRKIAIGTWGRSGDPSVYTLKDIDATALLKLIDTYKDQQIKLTPTVIVARGLALTFERYPQLNALVRFGRRYQREDINMFLQVAADDDDDNLSGIVIRKANEKSLVEMAAEIGRKSLQVKKKEKEDFGAIKKILDLFPGFLMRPLLAVMSFINYDLNCWFSFLKTPRDSFGSAMITSVGMLDIDQALVPLIPHSRCPLLIAIGKINLKPMVVDGKIEIRPVMTLGCTLDHRYIDGVQGGKMLKFLSAYLHNPH